MLSDGVIPLIESGVINKRKKKLNSGRSVTSFMNGTRRLFDFVDYNPEIRVMDIAYVNDTSIIGAGLRGFDGHVSVLRDRRANGFYPGSLAIRRGPSDHCNALGDIGGNLANRPIPT
jgi:hypothetical protein